MCFSQNAYIAQSQTTGGIFLFVKRVAIVLLLQNILFTRINFYLQNLARNWNKMSQSSGEK